MRRPLAVDGVGRRTWEILRCAQNDRTREAGTEHADRRDPAELKLRGYWCSHDAGRLEGERARLRLFRQALDEGRRTAGDAGEAGALEVAGDFRGVVVVADLEQQLDLDATDGHVDAEALM